MKRAIHASFHDAEPKPSSTSSPRRRGSVRTNTHRIFQAWTDPGLRRDDAVCSTVLAASNAIGEMAFQDAVIVLPAKRRKAGPSLPVSRVWHRSKASSISSRSAASSFNASSAVISPASIASARWP